MAKRLPAIFFGHGNPMNAIQTNSWTEAWRRVGASIGKPRAVLCISAHWFVPGTAVTVAARPCTIHDFGGFPRELFAVRYPAPGDPALAQRVRDLLAPLPVRLDDGWGLDHGTWSVLCHVYPEADVPIVQLSIDESRGSEFHYTLGCQLSTLRDEGILVVGSGNLVHNLHTYGWGRHVPEPFDWAARFEHEARRRMLDGAFEDLVEYERLGPDARVAIPTPEHYWPLLYVLGTRHEGEPVTFPVQGVDGGSISMLSVQIG